MNMTTTTLRFKNSKFFERAVRMLKEERISIEFDREDMTLDLCDSDLEAAIHELDCPHAKVEFEVLS